MEIIGEAVNKVSKQTLKKSNQPIRWRDIIGFRNIVTHEYFRVDYTIVYKIAIEEIPKLKAAIAFMIEELQKQNIK